MNMTVVQIDGWFKKDTVKGLTTKETKRYQSAPDYTAFFFVETKVGLFEMRDSKSVKHKRMIWIRSEVETTGCWLKCIGIEKCSPSSPSLNDRRQTDSRCHLHKRWEIVVIILPWKSFRIDAIINSSFNRIYNYVINKESQKNLEKITSHSPQYLHVINIFWYFKHILIKTLQFS